MRRFAFRLVGRLLAAALWLGLAAPASAGLRAFLEIRSTATIVPGTSSDPLYSGWIDLLGFGQSAAREHDFTPGAPSALATLPTFQLLKKVDAATPVLAGLLFSRAGDLSVHLVVAFDTPGRVEVWDLRCSPAALSEQRIEAQRSGSLIETLSITPGALEVAYIVTNPGNGSALAELFASINLITGATTSGTRAPWYRGDVDTDGDGIPDAVERFYGLDPFTSNSQLDSDGDGMTNLQEYLAGTNPLVPNSTFKVTQTQLQPAQGLAQLSWRSEVGKVYVIQSAATLAGPFVDVKTVLSAGAGTTTTTVPMLGGGRGFYRVRVQP